MGFTIISTLQHSSKTKFGIKTFINAKQANAHKLISMISCQLKHTPHDPLSNAKMLTTLDRQCTTISIQGLNSMNLGIFQAQTCNHQSIHMSLTH